MVGVEGTVVPLGNRILALALISALSFADSLAKPLHRLVSSSPAALNVGQHIVNFMHFMPRRV